MLFMYIHTHPVEKCTVDKPQDNAKMAANLQAEYKKAGVKLVAMYMAPHEHTFYMVLEANDITALEKANMAMTLWGTAKLVPVSTMEQWMPK
jgi:uncharacterized protein with GYD domain